MKHTIKNIILLTLYCLLTNCSNDFLNQDITSDRFSLGNSNIYISPDWQSSNKQFKLSGVKTADYEIVSKPSWLNVGSLTGHISDSIAMVQCSATKKPEYSSVGVYMEFMTVKANGKNYKVPVGYLIEGKPIAQVSSSINLSMSNPTLSIMNTGPGILLWDIVSMPSWLAIDYSRIITNTLFIVQNNSCNLPLILTPPQNATGILNGTIVLTTNDSQHARIEISVTANLGTPQLSLNTNTVNFSGVEVSKNFSFGNYGNGILTWEFKDMPAWLTITPTSGVYNPYTSYNNITFTCNRSKLSPGMNTAYVTLKTNDSSHPTTSITVTAMAPGNNANIRAITGNVADAVFNKNTNTLYYVTSSPNKLIAYDVINRTIVNEIALGKAPTCLAISEDWSTAAVGHNGSLSAINLSSSTVTATYPLDYSVNNIAWCEKSWFCVTQNGGSFSGLHWFNTVDGTKYDETDTYSLDGKSITKKVPNQPYLIATRGTSSPSGFFAFSIATKSQKSYAHMDLSKFWFSEDGQYIYDQNSNIYRTTSSTGSTEKFNNTINAIGKISTSSTYLISYIYHSNNNLWIIQNDTYTYYGSPDATTSIYQVEDNDYTLVKKYSYDQLYQPAGQSTPLNVNAKYIFANSTGTELSVLCKSTTDNNWIIQFIPVK